MMLMTQKQSFSLFVCCLIVVSKYPINARECYVCNTDDHENCTLGWTEEEVKRHAYDGYLQECAHLCTQTIGSRVIL